jgi:hypothetical protein
MSHMLLLISYTRDPSASVTPLLVVLSCVAAEWPVHLERVDDVSDGSGGGDHRNDEAGGAERLEADPLGAPSGNLALHDVHLDGEVDGERPEGNGAEQADDVAKEGQQHGGERGEADERRAPREAEHADDEGACPDLLGNEGAVGPALPGPVLDEGEERLAEDLVGPHEVHDDGDVGDVQQPEGLVEAEADEEVAGGVVAERGVAHAAAQHVEGRGGQHAHQRRRLHHLRLRRRRRLDGVLRTKSTGVGQDTADERRSGNRAETECTVPGSR